MENLGSHKGNAVRRAIRAAEPPPNEWTPVVGSEGQGGVAWKDVNVDRFTEEYKRQAAELVVSSGRSITSGAKELGLRVSVLRRWVNKLRREPTSAARMPHDAGGDDVGGPGGGGRPCVLTSRPERVQLDV